MLRNLAALTALAPMLWMSSVQALGLGDIEVHSRLNQRFSATIPVLSAATEDLESLKVSIAGDAAFERAGIDRSELVSTLKFVQTGNGVKVSSVQAVRDPFVSFIVEARWNGGRFLREYTVLLDPPGASAATASAPGSAAAPAAATADNAGAAVVMPAPEPFVAEPPVAGTSGAYGPVQASQTLWSIAKQLRRDPGVSMDQMLLALYEGNPQAFGGSINRLLSGSLLTVPTIAQATAVDAATARSRVAELRGQPVSAAAGIRAAVAPPVAVEPPAATVPPVPPSVDAAPMPAAAAVPAVEPDPPAASVEPSADQVAPIAAEAPVDAASAPTPAPAPAPAPAAIVEPGPAPAAPATLPTEVDSLPLPLIGGLLMLVLALVLMVLRRRVKIQSTASAAMLPPEALWLSTPLVADPLFDERAKTPVAGNGAAPAKPVIADPSSSKPDAPGLPGEAEPEAVDELPPLPDSERLPESDAGREPGLNLDSGDPLTEADFHIAYGLHDEAIQMLRKAIAEEPARTELKLKLAEVYAAAGRPAELQSLAASLSGQLTNSEAARLAAVRQGLLPEATLSASGPEVAAEPAAAQRQPVQELSVTDFDLDIDLPAAESAVAEPPPAPPVEPKPSPATDGADPLSDPDNFDLAQGSGGQQPDPGLIDFSFDELDLAAEPEPLDPLSAAADESDTKLDLARAYADMGDVEAAGALLAEVIASGSEQQQSEAEALKLRLKDVG